MEMMRKRHAAMWMAAVVSAGLGLGCSRPGAQSGDSPEEAGAQVYEVSVTTASRGEISRTLNVTGTIAALPNRDVKVSSLVPGRIASMAVAEGDGVREGQVLAGIEDRPFLDQIQQAEGAVAQAKANLENARLNLTRNETLFQRGVAAGKDLEDARTLVSVNEATLRQAEAALALARLQLSRTQVRSPLDGIVVKRLMSVGEQVDGTAAQPIFEIANTAQVELFGNVPAIYLEKMRPGQEFAITTDAAPGEVFQGRVVAVSPAVDPSTNVGLVRIRMANHAGLLRLGMFLSAQAPLEAHSGTLVVPSQAVYRDDQGQPHVYLVRGGRAEAVPVKLGIETQDRVELLSGVKEGDTVILSGGYGLESGAPVKVRP